MGPSEFRSMGLLAFFVALRIPKHNVTCLQWDPLNSDATELLPFWGDHEKSEPQVHLPSMGPFEFRPTGVFSTVTIKIPSSSAAFLTHLQDIEGLHKNKCPKRGPQKVPKTNKPETREKQVQFFIICWNNFYSTFFYLEPLYAALFVLAILHKWGYNIIFRRSF